MCKREGKQHKNIDISALARAVKTALSSTTTRGLVRCEAARPRGCRPNSRTRRISVFSLSSSGDFEGDEALLLLLEQLEAVCSWPKLSLYLTWSLPCALHKHGPRCLLCERAHVCVLAAFVVYFVRPGLKDYKFAPTYLSVSWIYAVTPLNKVLLSEIPGRDKARKIEVNQMTSWSSKGRNLRL